MSPGWKKLFERYGPAGLAIAAAVLAAWFWRSREVQQGGGMAGNETERSPAIARVAPQPGPRTPAGLAHRPDPASGSGPMVAMSPDTPSEVKAFRDWARDYFAAEPADRPGMESRGMELARAHTQVLASLIRSDPRRAIENAVPMVLRQDLPAAVVGLLEDRVNVRASLNVLGTAPDPSLKPEEQAPPISRRVVTEDGRHWRAFTYGRRGQQTSRQVASLNGVAVKTDFAVSDSPLRVLEIGERPVSGGREVVTQCPVSGIVTSVQPAARKVLPPVTAETPAFETPQRIVYVCSGGHIAAVEEQLYADEYTAHWKAQGVVAASGAGSGPAVSPFSVPTTWTTGQRKMLYIRATFPERRADPQSEAECQDSLRQMCDFVVQASSGRCYFTSTVAPLVVLPYPESWYIQYDQDTGGAGDDLLVSHARTIARTMGYDTAQYNFDVVRWDSDTVGPYGGLAFIGAKGIRLKNNVVGTFCHELGHNLGVWHANFWQTSPPSVIGPGQNLEYGNLFDVMGNAYDVIVGHYTAFFKDVIGWLPQETFWTVNASGTYRIHQIDAGIANPDQRFALRINRDAERDYWCEFRQRHTTNPALMNGLMLTWDSWGIGGLGSFGGTSPVGSDAGTHLLDMTPGSFGNGITDTRDDSALYVGRTYSDPDAGIHVTPVARNPGTSPPSMDVVVNLGAFPGNQNPVLAIGASSNAIGTGTAITLTATASDPDGDTLAYAWSFDDGAYSINNGPVQTKSWTSAGHYRVLCTASDMRGGRTTRGVTIMVGSPTTYLVSGTVTGPGGLPLEGVYVANYAPFNLATHPNSSTFRGTWTDSDGNYTLTRVTAGTRTISPTLYPNVFAPSGFTNPLVINGDAAGINFTGVLLPTITITAPDNQAAEGPSPDPGTIRIQRSGSTAAPLAVQVFDSSSGTATRTADYTLSPAPTAVSGGYGASQFIIPAGAASLDITVTPADDALQEGVEYAVLDFVNTAAGYVISGPTTGTVSISDDDSNLPVVRLSALDAVAGEAGSDPATLRLERSGSTAANLVVTIAYAGSAALGTDYTASTSVTIPSGSASTVFTITPIDDSEQEGTETIVASIFAKNTAYLADALASSQTVVLMDNDLPVVSIVATDSNAAEAGLDSGEFTITRTGGNIALPLTVDYALSGRAVHGADYLRLDGQAVIPAGAASASILIQPVDDAVSEGPQDVICQLRSSTAYAIGVPAQATVNIADNDGAQVYLKLVASGGSEPASGTSVPIQFQVIRPVAGPAITVNYTVGGSATPGSDYTPLPGTVAFTASDTSKTISVNALPDVLFEDAESVIVTLQPGTGYSFLPGQDTSATGFIIDQDQPTVDVSVADAGSALKSAGTEAGSSLRFIVSRRVSAAGPLTVDYTMSGTAVQGIDYAGVSGSVTIPADAPSAYVDISPVDDGFAEGVETIVMILTASPGIYGRGIALATMQLADNDSYVGGTVGFANAASTADETVGTWAVPVNLTGSSGGATVRYRVSGGTATGGGKDYTLAEGILSFSPAQTNRNLAFAIHPDSVPEPDETVVIELFNAVGANLGVSSHTVTISNVSLPETWTDPASAVLLTSATLNGHVRPNGLATSSWFEYGSSTAYGSATAPQPAGSGAAPVNVIAPVSGLSLSGYHFRCVSQNSAGTTHGADQFFGVDATPGVVTLAASAVSGTGATLNGTVNANGLGTTVSFEYGPTTAYGATVAASPSSVTGALDTPVTAVVSGLASGVLYHCRARGVSSAGTRVGNDITFTTVNASPVASFISAPTTATARIPVTYSASATDANGDALTYAWDFGPAYPLQFGASIKQTFLFGGTVNLTLTVSDGHGGAAVLTRVITVTDPLRNWTQMPSGTTDDLGAVAAGFDKLVAVGSHGRILTSADGATWTPRSLVEYSVNIYFKNVTWDGTRFIAVGYDYDFGILDWVGVIYTSPTGVIWLRNIVPAGTPELFGVAGDGFVSIAVGLGGTLLRSTGGTTWTRVTLPDAGPTEDLFGAAWGAGVFAITDGSGGSVKVRTSPDGLTWTDHTSGSGLANWQDMSRIASLNGRFVGSGWYSRIRTSTNDGQTFTTTRTADEDTPALAYGDGIYFAAGVNRSASDADVNVTSVDGQTWQSAPAPTNYDRNGAAFYNHQFYTVGDLGEIWRSEDVSAPPSILTQPQGTVVLKGDSVQFSVFAIGSDPLTYRWRKNGATIAGATGATFAIASAKSTDTASYDVVVDNGIGSVTSVAATLVVNSPAEIVTQPVGGAVLVGGAKVFSLVATGDAPLVYQWRKDGVVMDGKITPTLPLTDIHVEDAGIYDCVVTNGYGTATSNPAQLNVLDKFVALGAATFTVDENVPGGVLIIPVLRTGNPSGTTTVTFTTSNGTALAGSDFTPPATLVTIPGGVSSVDVPIAILNPANTPEANETFTVTLGNPSLGTGVISPSSATVIIVDTTAYSNTADTTAPGTPVISYPGAAALVAVNSGAVLKVTGTAADNKGVKQVQAAVNGGGFADATLGAPGAPSTSFTFPFVPATGPNTIQVKSIDFANRTSSVVTRSFTVTRALAVEADAALGSLTAGFAGTTFREVNRNLSVTATPKPATATPFFAGSIFAGWSLGGADVANGGIPFTPQRIGVAASAIDKGTLNFIFREGLVLTANFVASPYAPMAGTYNGLIRPSTTLPDRPPGGSGPEDGTTRTNSTEGFFSATVTSTGSFSGKLTIDASVLSVAGAFDHNGIARFGTARAFTLTVARVNKPSLILALQMDLVTPGSNDKITGTVSATDFKRSVAAAVSTVDADRAFYNGTTQIVPASYLAAANANGVFTTAFPAKDPVDQPAGFTIQDYPQGDGIGTITVTKAGVVTVAGTLADGTPLSASSTLSEAKTFPLFAQLYNKLGFLSGFVALDSAQPGSDMAAGNLRWLRPTQNSSHYYPYGWPEVITTDLIAAKYAVTAGQSVLKAATGANLQAADADGNATLSFVDGQLGATMNRFVNLTTADVVTKVPGNDPSFTLSINRATGAISGTFTHDDDTVPAYQGIILQKGANARAYGFFLTKQPTPIDYTGESGGVSLIGQP